MFHRRRMSSAPGRPPLYAVGGKRQARINAAEQEHQLATNYVTISRAELRAEVVAAYLEALNASERANLVSASLELAQKASNAATKRLLAGKMISQPLY